MKKKQNIKITFLIVSLVMFGMIPVYCFFLMENSNLTWYPVPMFLTFGILSLINYFIMHMEHISVQTTIPDGDLLSKEETEMLDKVA